MKTPEYMKSPTVVVIILTLLSSWWFGLFAAIPARMDAVPTYDAVFFIKLAENIARHRDLGWIAYHEPLFYPALTALLASVTGDLYVAAVLISKISAVLLPGVVFLLARNLYSTNVGLGAALLTLFFPHLRVIAGTSQSEALYVLLITGAVTLLRFAWQRGSLPLSATAGLAFAASYLTRSEGIFTMLLLCAFLACAGQTVAERTKLWQCVAVTLITFTLLCSPYISYLSSHYGTVTIGTKTSGIYFWVRDKCFHDPDPERAEWGLSPRGELNLISMQSRDLLRYWGKDLSRSVRVYLKNFSEQLPGRIPNDGAIKHYPQVYPLYLALPLVAGMLLVWRRRDRETCLATGYLLSGFALLFIYPLLTGGWWRYLINLLPFFLILAALGSAELAGILGKGRAARLVPVVALTVITGYHIWVVAGQAAPSQVVSYRSDKNSISEEVKKAGAWVRSLIPPDATYMVQWTRLPYYLHGRWIALPEAGLDDVMNYARKHSVQYILIESGDAGSSLQLAQLGVPGISYLGTYSSQTVNYYCTLLRLN